MCASTWVHRLALISFAVAAILSRAARSLSWIFRAFAHPVDALRLIDQKWRQARDGDDRNHHLGMTVPRTATPIGD